jgi:hypothetical protein
MMFHNDCAFDRRTQPAFAGGAIGGECNLIVFDRISCDGYEKNAMRRLC